MLRVPARRIKVNDGGGQASSIDEVDVFRKVRSRSILISWDLYESFDPRGTHDLSERFPTHGLSEGSDLFRSYAFVKDDVLT